MFFTDIDSLIKTNIILPSVIRINAKEDMTLTVFKMNAEGKLKLLVLCSLYLYAMHEGETANMEQLMSCARSCTNAVGCKWVVYLDDSRQCLCLDTLNCTLASRNRTNIFRRTASEKTLSETRGRQSVFQLVDANLELCSASVTSCGSPPSVPNATVEHDALNSGSKARYLCFEGFSFCGPTSQEINCMSNGSWPKLASGCVRDHFNTVSETPISIPCPLTEGTTMVVSGFPLDIENGKSSFIVYLFKIRDMLYNVEYATEVSFSEKSAGEVVLISMERSEREPADTFPFTILKDFNLTITFKDKGYELSVDDQLIAFSNYRTPVGDLTHFGVVGDIKVYSVTFLH